MRFSPLPLRVRLLVIAVVALMSSLSIILVKSWKSSAVQTNQEAEGKRQLHNRVRDGVGHEVQFASAGDSPGSVRASVNSVSNFIFKRSGVRLSGVSKDRLAELERRTLTGEARRLSLDDLSDALTQTVFERLATLTNDEVIHADDTLRGFDAPDLPKRYSRRDIVLPGKVISISQENFRSQLRAMRDQANSPVNGALRGTLRREIAEDVRTIVGNLSEAVPEKFGAFDSDTNRARSSGLTPLQALLAAYAVTSQDLLCDSEANLGRRMQGLQEAYIRRNGDNYPSPQGHFAFGVNGYLASTPLDLLFDERTLNRLLDHIQERSGK